MGIIMFHNQATKGEKKPTRSISICEREGWLNGYAR